MKFYFSQSIIITPYQLYWQINQSHGFNGFIFNEGDLNDLKEKIILILSDNNKVKEYGDNSLLIIEKEINIYTVINGYSDALKYLATN